MHKSVTGYMYLRLGTPTIEDNMTIVLTVAVVLIRGFKQMRLPKRTGVFAPGPWQLELNRCTV